MFHCALYFGRSKIGALLQFHQDTGNRPQHKIGNYFATILSGARALSPLTRLSDRAVGASNVCQVKISRFLEHPR